MPTEPTMVKVTVTFTFGYDLRDAQYWAGEDEDDLEASAIADALSMFDSVEVSPSSTTAELV